MYGRSGHVGHVFVPQPHEAVHEICLKLAQRLLRRCLNCHTVRILG